ncbi:hypothetical protein N0M98_17945 [Paenibacillus doosanensis]|uniref:Uncharacterized protein n=1 Tax=Paenibacillus konkukensis TaxID=2020716 RepID=A0ABY4RRF2_9BACL|nr:MULTISPECIES: hypothetical protein [Paenibacillus]MCS7462023.1 hypothetical protein [Paenibacillus doosanensis]UQZ85086.1 hypothetical protein SK3146_04369 [Paenibacillus konkukensis]
MSSQFIQPQQTLYQADPAFVQSVKRTREQLYDAGRKSSNRPIRVQTVDGQVHEGTIAHMDNDHLYLRVPNPNARGFFGPWGPWGGPSPVYNDVILPLVLYNLLVISLL